MKQRRVKGEGMIRQRPNGLWEIRITVDGKRRSFYAPSQNAAKAKLRELAYEIGRNEYVDETLMTVGQWLDLWLAEYVTIRPSTAKRYERDVRLYFKPAFGDVRLKDLTTAMLQHLYISCTRKGLSAKTVHNMHGTIHEALRMAVKFGYIRSNVSEACDLPRTKRTEMHPLKDDKLVEFLEAIKGDRFEDMFFVAIFTGLRESELIGLTWDCVDFRSGRIRIYRQYVKCGSENNHAIFEFAPLKNGRERIVEPAPQVLDRLEQIKEKQTYWETVRYSIFSNPNNFVFTDEVGNHVNYHTLYNHMKSIAASIGMPECRVHDLRHTFATLSLQNGSDIKTVSDALGHATSSFTLDRYGHVSDAMRRNNALRMKKLLDDLEGL